MQAASSSGGGGQASNGSLTGMKDILERKWTSVAKLKKELDELTK